MFSGSELKSHFETSPTIKIRSLVLAEWNMNFPENILKLGNYRYRPGSDGIYASAPSAFDPIDSGNYYTNATDADITIDSGYAYDSTEAIVPQSFTFKKNNLKLLYSLEDCIKPFRPRSGINKASYFNGRYLNHVNEYLSTRPRYYMPSRDDYFKYWTSYRTENGVALGISKNLNNGISFIDDAVPFVIYKNPVPANRINIKMQTHVGTTNLGTFQNGTTTFADPFYGSTNKAVPSRFKIQYLKNNQWITAMSFDETSTRSDGSAIIPEDGNLELSYGLVVPDQFANNFVFVGKVASSNELPEKNINGYAYLIVSNSTDKGVLHVWNQSTKQYNTFTPQYKWSLIGNEITSKSQFVTDLTNPESFKDTTTLATEYREFCYINGIRVLVESMTKSGTTFDLIEMSPRLVVDLSSKVVGYEVKKSLSDLGITSLPVGQLLASTGSLTIFDDDQSFNENNTLSIIKNYINKNIKFLFYEGILDVNNANYTVPIKTLYSEGFPQADNTGVTVTIQLRDLFFLFESIKAPQILLTDVSLSYAVSILMDAIGFTNYTFYRVTDEKEPIIPYFFISPDKSVAEILNELAISTQTAMYFDEYNNFVVMSKNYLMPTSTQRSSDYSLIGSNTQQKTGIVQNKQIVGKNLANIISVASQDKKIYNAGRINYTERYVQRSYGSIQQPYVLDNKKSWVYKPSLLWEVSGTETTKTVNEKSSQQSTFVLAAMPLNSDLSANLPTVVNNQLTNNVIDVGENIYWNTRYQGYFYSHGEIIRYDAVQFNVPIVNIVDGQVVEVTQNNVWISSNQEYQNYFSKLSFNGKIYPTGLIRIFATPYYETANDIVRMKNGPVFEHGRGQFGTEVTSHSAGLPQHWSSNDNVRGCNMQSQWLFNINQTTELPALSSTNEAAGVNNDLATKSLRTGVIKNFLANYDNNETSVNVTQTTQSGTIQSSAFIMNGPSFKTTENPLNFISYVYKPLDSSYKHFGTRMRIVGRLENNETKVQTPIGSVSYYQVPGSANPEQNINIAGGSGGIAVLLDEKTNNGYYFEIIALTEGNIESYTNQSEKINNVIFYKIKKDAANNNAIPVKLYGGLAKIIVDDGAFAGQERISGDENNTVYDLSVEYEDFNGIRRFYLYLNNKLIATVDDDNPLPIYHNSALFVRGSSRCMFENIYALTNNYAKNSSFAVGKPLSSAFDVNDINVSNAFSRYSLSGLLQATYLSGISSQSTPDYKLYFEEFGSIFRECAYFNIRYDKAYPALYARLAPTLNKLKGYTVSGFIAGPYGAEFLVFNNADTALSLDESSGNYLKIQGVTFTQDTVNEYTVDNYFSKRGNLSDPELSGTTVLTSPVIQANQYNDIKISRMNYGINEFSIAGEYIQSQDQAEELMGWIINKVMTPKKSIGVDIFATPILQLGDIVTIDYSDNSIDLIAKPSDRFVVYNISYARSSNGPKMTIYLSEV